MNLRTVLAALCLAATATNACRNRSAEPPPPAPSAPAPAAGPATLKIWISKPGVIEMNGRAAQLAEVSAALDALAKQDGEVIFGQDLPDKEPHPNVVKVLQLIADRRLTFRSTSSRSFSDLAPDHHYDKN